MKEDKKQKLKKKETFKTKKNEKQNLIKNEKNSFKRKKKDHGYFASPDDSGSKRFLKNEKEKTVSTEKKHIKKNSFDNEFMPNMMKNKTINKNGEYFEQSEEENSKNLNSDYKRYYRNKNNMNKNNDVNISSDSESNFTTNSKIELCQMKEKETPILEEITDKIEINNELKDNIYFSSDEQEDISIEENNQHSFNLQNQQKQIDYISYMNELHQKNENKKNGEVRVDNCDNDGEKKKEIEREREKKYKIFLIFAPLAITGFNYKNNLINADDHLEMFERKKKELEELLANEKNPRKRLEWEEKIEKIRNNLKNTRSDIVFFTLLSLRDSILNKKKQLQIYIHTINNLLIYVSPEFHVPRSFHLFKKVMTTLLTKNVVYDNEGNVLLQVLRNPISYYIQDSICVGVSNNGFPTDAKKFADKVKASNKNYSFFFSLSNLYDVTHIIQKETSRRHLKWDKQNNQQFIATDNTTYTSCSYHYYIRISDLHLTPIIICSKLTHFLI